jgi:hypothetical protein
VNANSPNPIVTLTPAVSWLEIDAKTVKGRPARLAWSDDRATLYLQSVEGHTRETLRFHHYLVRRGGALSSVGSQPAWVEDYWTWKSAKSLVGDPQLTIDVETRRELLDNLNGIGVNLSVFLSDAPNGISGQDLITAKQSGGTRLVTRLLLKGHIVGEFVDEMIVPGYTFSWSPEDLRLIAYRALSGRLTIMDDEGRTETISATKDVLLPAWSEDGAAIAYLERTGGGRHSLRVVEVVGR